MKSKYLHLSKENPNKIKKCKKCSEIKWKWKIKSSFKSKKAIVSCNKLMMTLNLDFKLLKNKGINSKKQASQERETKSNMIGMICKYSKFKKNHNKSLNSNNLSHKNHNLLQTIEKRRTKRKWQKNKRKNKRKRRKNKRKRKNKRNRNKKRKRKRKLKIRREKRRN